MDETKDEIMTSSEDTLVEEEHEEKQVQEQDPVISSADAEVVYEFLKVQEKPVSAKTIGTECGIDDPVSTLKALQSAGKVAVHKKQNKFFYVAN